MTSNPRTRKSAVAPVPTADATASDIPQTGDSGEYRDLPLNRLVTNPRNGRKRLRGIDELAATIKDVGVIEPLIVRPHDGDTFQICFGHRRFAAATLAGLRVVPCRVKHLDDSQVLKEGLIENVQRDDLTYLEEAEQLGELMELRSFTVQQLADDLGQSPTRVKQRLSLLTLPDKARTALDNAVITYGTALALTEIADYPDEINELIDEQDGVDADQLQEAIRWVGIQRDCVRLRDEAAARGWRLIEAGEPRGLGYVYLAELEDLTPARLAAHARQSCHAVYLEVALGRARLTGLCSNPDRHRPATPTPAAAGTPEGEVRRVAAGGDPMPEVRGDEGQGEDDEAQARAEAANARQVEREERERQEKEETRNRRRVAAARRSFLSGLIGKRTPKRAEVMAYVFGAVIEKASQTTMGWVAKILGLEPVTGRFGTTNWHTPVMTYATQNSDQLLKVVLLVTSHWAEEHITQYATGYDGAVVRHIELLGALGYVPDPYESEQIARYRQSTHEASQPIAAEVDSQLDDDDADRAGEPDGVDVGDESGEIQVVENPDESEATEEVNTEF